MLDYLKKLLLPNERVEAQPLPNKANPESKIPSSKVLEEALNSLPIDQALLTLDFDPCFQKDTYPTVSGGYVVPNGLVLDTVGSRQIIKSTVFRRVKVRQDTATTGTVFLEANDEFIIKLAGLRNFREVGDVLGTLVLMN